MAEHLHESEIENRGTGRAQDVTVPVTLPRGVAPEVIPALVEALEKAAEVLHRREPELLQRADRLAELATGVLEPTTDLIEDRMQRLRTMRRVLDEGEWLTAEQLNALQPDPPANASHPASDWKRRKRIFSVSYGGRDYFPRYQFDAMYQPLPIIKEILAAFGEVADPWLLAAWFHFPNGWIVRRDDTHTVAVAPKDALDRRDAVLAAAARRPSSYVA